MKRIRRRVPQRTGPPPKIYGKVAAELLEHAERIWSIADGLDTAVRDTVAQALAYIVHSAFDTQSIAAKIPSDGSHAYITGATEQWFRDRGFAEWFCHGAGQLFHTSRPRIMSEMKVKIRRVKPSRNARSTPK